MILLSCIRDKTIIFFYIWKQKKNNSNNHKLDTTTFSGRSKYIIVLNSCFTLNHRGKNVLTQPSNLLFRSNVVITLYSTLWYYYGALVNASFDIISSPYMSSVSFFVLILKVTDQWNGCVVGFQYHIISYKLLYYYSYIFVNNGDVLI